MTQILQEADRPAVELQEATVNVAEAYERGKTDINFFAALALPTVFEYPLPYFYVSVWQILANRKPEDIGKLLRFALGLPRGHAKTTFIKILIVWFIVYDKVSFALIVCANADLADALLADIHDILSSPNITAIYGDWTSNLITDSADTKKAFYHGRSVVLVSRGWSAGVRGLNLKNMRPDLIFCDDVQTKKNDKSPADRQALLSELVGTIFKAIAPRGNRLIIYVGNMYSEDCILNMFRKSSSWISLITGAILSDGTPLWPELFSLEELMESYEHDEQLGEAKTWFAEVMNDPQAAAETILPFPIPESPLKEIPDPDGVFITIDPAGFRNSSDDNVIVVHYKHDNIGYVMQTVRGVMNPEQMVKDTLALALQHGASLIAVEDVGYQQTLLFWFEYFMKEFHISDIYVVPLKPHGRSKESRIRLFIESLYAKNYYIVDPVTRREFTWQASLYKLGKKDNKDDLLDGVAYGEDVRNEYWHLITNLNRMRGAITADCRVVGNNTCF